MDDPNFESAMLIIKERDAIIETLREAADNFLHEQTEENANKLAAVLGGFPVRGYEQKADEK
jgi:hypothetical protein